MLGEMGIIKSGRNKSRQENGIYPVYGSTGLIGRTNEYSVDGDCILIARVGANAGLVNFVTGKFDVSDNTLVFSLNSRSMLKFIFYLLVNMNLNRFVKGGGQPLLTASQLAKIKIPIPPLSEQRRIVSILDHFDTLTNDLASGLPAEIAAREKQYAYYRDKLLSFPRKGA